MDIYKLYKSDPKVTIYKLIKGKRGFDTAIEMLFGDDVSGGKEYASKFSESQKKTAIFFIYKRKLIKNYKIGVKLSIGEGKDQKSIGEEYRMDQIPKGWPANI